MAEEHENMEKLCTRCFTDQIYINYKEEEESKETGILLCEYCKEAESE